MNIKYDKIGFRLAKRRKKLKYTQPQLAEIVGISKNHISQFENGGSVSLEVLLDLCDALKITPDYLLLEQFEILQVKILLTLSNYVMIMKYQFYMTQQIHSLTIEIIDNS